MPYIRALIKNFFGRYKKESLVEDCDEILNLIKKQRRLTKAELFIIFGDSIEDIEKEISKVRESALVSDSIGELYSLRVEFEKLDKKYSIILDKTYDLIFESK